jgi:nicotinamide-nucleotide amidase
MSAHLITIGNELLTGEITDTNSGWLIKELNKIGLRVSRVSIIEDDETILKNQLTTALSEQAKFVIITGGMGATKDDVTRKVIAEFFCIDLYLNTEVLASVKRILKKKNRPFLDLMVKQAMVPNGAQIMLNDVGTAPGIIMKTQDTLFAFLPGVPAEMKYIVESQLLPIIKKSNYNFTCRKSAVCSKTEIEISSVLETLDFSEFHRLKIAYLLHAKGVKLNIENSGTNPEQIDSEIQKVCELITDKLHTAFNNMEVKFK